LSLQFTPAFSLRVLLVRAISSVSLLFFFTDPATTEIYTLSLHDALPIFAFAQTRTEHPRHVHITGLADGQLLAINRGNNAEAGVAEGGLVDFGRLRGAVGNAHRRNGG